MTRFILSVREEARVQYEVEAASEDEVRRLYLRGDVGPALIDEHQGGGVDEIVDVTAIGGAS